ncbi:MAG: response regulator [Gemmatimonadaceae bacterium]
MKKIALIDDDADNRLLVRAIVNGRYAVAEYASGPEALAGMRLDRPDVVLLDVLLPRHSGPTVLRWLRDDPSLRDLPVIAVTAHAMAGDRERLLVSGFDDYVSKPIVDEDVLLQKIDRWVEGGVRPRTPRYGPTQA